MRGYVTGADGVQWELPPLTAWKMEYTCGSPCDSFWVSCPWDADNTALPSRWSRFSARYADERVFTGVVDECTVTMDGGGCRLEVSGRGMAAVLLDNEALGQDYAVATLEDILRDHVTPYGVETAPGAAVPAAEDFSVAVGSSEWSVVYDFARYHGGVCPRFDRLGRLILTGWEDSREIPVGDGARVTGLTCRDRRYGVLSQVLVRDRYSGAVQRVENSGFAADGGMARRVLTMPGRSSYKAMRYTGDFQLASSAAGLEQLELTVADIFQIWPGDLVRLQRSSWGRNGLFRAARVTVSMDGQGGRSRVELVRPDAMI